jgi:hypothetical protein
VFGRRSPTNRASVNRPFNCGFVVNSLFFDITAGFRVLSEVASLMMMFGVGASPC